MRLILHIGTHKTGTSALQECLRRNKRTLADKGIYYVHLARSTHCNGLARLVAKKRRAEVTAFLERHIDKARMISADTLIISAESFYAMTMFFHKFNGRENNYWNSESEAIELLHSALPSDMRTRLVVFFRRQDYFLESIYQQVIKSTRSISMRIDEFRVFLGEALDYWRNMQMWSAFFPDCVVYTHEEASSNISEFFIRKVLEIENAQEFEELDLRANVRLNRDVLEYKRILNGMELSAVDRRMNKLACTELARTLADDRRYQDYLAPDDRAALLREMGRGNALLSEKFGMTPFPALSDDNLRGWSPYPGLSTEKTSEIAERHARIKRSAGYRIERSALLAREFIQRHLPMLAWIIPLGRSLLPRHRHQS